MEFNFSLWNHGAGRATCIPIVTILAHQLADLGHRVSFAASCLESEAGKKSRDQKPEHLLSPPAVNVFLESFESPRAVDYIKDFDQQGLRFIIIMTEAPGRRGFNDTHGGRHEILRYRQFQFPRAARYAAGIGCLVSTGVDFARESNPKSFYLDTGYSRSLAAKRRGNRAPSFDYAFSGGVGDRRYDIITALRHAGLSVVLPEKMYGSLDDRDATLRKAYGVLGIRADDKWNIPSGTRFSDGLHLGCFIAPELHDIQTRWSDVLDFPATQDVNDYIAHAIKLARHPGLSFQRQWARFTDLMAPERTMKPFLEAVFGDEAISAEAKSE